MNWPVLYCALGMLSLWCTACSIARVRRIYALVLLYYPSAWLWGDLALIHLLWQLSLTVVAGSAGVLSNPVAWGGLALFGLSWIGLVYLHIQAMDTGVVLDEALRRGLGKDFTGSVPADRQWALADAIHSRHWLHPVRFRRQGVQVQRDISYGDAGKRNLLDIYHPARSSAGGSPVLLQVHGGGWMTGSKRHQGLPLVYHMAERGWLCVAINYRLSPRWAFPAHIIDIKRAIAWIRQHIHEYGGNPEFIAITGGSAGGHLSALAALTPNLAQWQPGFEQVDTTLQAAVPCYGTYDLTDRYRIRRSRLAESMLARNIMQCSLRDHPDRWREASPLDHLGAAAPPMFVIHGTHDVLLWSEETRKFVAALRELATEPVVYGELPGAQHAFDMFHSVRTEHTIHAVGRFLEWSHARFCRNRP